MSIGVKFSDGHSIPCQFVTNKNFFSIHPDTILSKLIYNKTQTLTTVNQLKINFSTDSIPIDSNRIDKLFHATATRDNEIIKVHTSNKFIKSSDSVQFHGNTTNLFNDFTPRFYSSSGIDRSNLNNNFLLNIKEKTIHLFYKGTSSLVEQKKLVRSESKTETNNTFGYEGRTLNPAQSGWYIIVLLLSISIFTWGKAIYHKYIFQVLESIYNFQLSVRLFRDKNILFRNLSILLQILFSLTVGIFISVFFTRFQYHQLFDSPLFNMLVYSIAIYVFFSIKYLIYNFLGLVFKTQEEFSEISHQISLFNKVFGIILLPIVSVIPFINEKAGLVLIFVSFALFFLFTILFLYRSYQIIRNKQISIFFLILYLCTIEILPMLLLVKASKTII